jgi:5-methylthioadenosine/S-adenosylhomocysteine deaminase
MTILIKNGLIITMSKDGRIINDGALAIEDNKIVAVGENGDLKKNYGADEVIDASSKAVLPGLINTHMHIGYTILRGLIRESRDWVVKAHQFIEQMTAEECYASALLGCLEMIRSGTTTFLENNYHNSDLKNFDGFAKAVEKTGIRACLAQSIPDRGPTLGPTEDIGEARKQIERLVNTWQGGAEGRIRVWIHLVYPGIRESSDRLLEIKNLIEKHKLRITAHHQEFLPTTLHFLRKYGIDQTRYLFNLGLLNQNLVVSHSVWLTDAEIAMLKETDVKVSHCPVANMYLGDGIASIVHMLKSGLTVSLGTDAMENNDMFHVMNCAALLQKVLHLDPEVMFAEDILKMATMQGARALGMENDVGSIELGKKADVILIDLKRPHLLPAHDVISNIVYSANGNDVDAVIVDGKIVMENREIKTVNEEEVMEKAVAAADGVAHKARKANRYEEISKMIKKSYEDTILGIHRKE